MSDATDPRVLVDEAIREAEHLWLNQKWLHSPQETAAVLHDTASALTAALDRAEKAEAERDAAQERPATAETSEIGWREIASAPKDGSWFWVHDDGDAILVRWHDGFKAFVKTWREIRFAKTYGGEVRLHSPEIVESGWWMPALAKPSEDTP